MDAGAFSLGAKQRGGGFDCRSRKFSADDASQGQLTNKFSILATDVLKVGQQTSIVLKHKSRELKSFTVMAEKNESTIIILGSSHDREIGPMLARKPRN
jgi:hypothetical protein